METKLTKKELIKISKEVGLDLFFKTVQKKDIMFILNRIENECSRGMTPEWYDFYDRVVSINKGDEREKKLKQLLD